MYFESLRLPDFDTYPITEMKRFHAFHRSGFSDRPLACAFDCLTELACRLLNTPIALIALVDSDLVEYDARARAILDLPAAATYHVDDFFATVYPALYINEGGVDADPTGFTCENELPGRVWQHKTPLWLTTVTSDATVGQVTTASAKNRKFYVRSARTYFTCGR